MTGLFLCSLVAFACSCALTYVLRILSRRLGWCSPCGQLKHHGHTRPIPRLGGVAICIALLLAVCTAALLPRKLFESGVTISLLAAIAPAALLMFCTGLLDDWHPQSARRKLVLQIGAALLVLWRAPAVFGVPAWSNSPAVLVISVLAAAFWMVMLTNGLNLIDGMDGLAASTAIIACGALLTAALILHDPAVAYLSAVLAGALLGFLPFNIHPASIFLGDCGSLLIGFLLGAGSLVLVRGWNWTLAACFLIACFVLPIGDTLLAVMRRAMSGRSIFSPDREHIHHQLLSAGLSPHAVLQRLGAVALIFAAISLGLMAFGLRALLIAIPALFGIACLAFLKLRSAEISELKHMTTNVGRLKPALRQDIAFRRAAHACNTFGGLPQALDLLQETFEQSGFDALEIRLHQGVLKHNGARGLIVGPNGIARYRWSRNGQAARTASLRAPAWRLAVDLIGDGQKKTGVMVVTRDQQRGPVLGDINLLVFDLANAVGAVVSRAAETELAPENPQIPAKPPDMQIA